MLEQNFRLKMYINPYHNNKNLFFSIKKLQRKRHSPQFQLLF